MVDCILNASDDLVCVDLEVSFVEVVSFGPLKLAFNLITLSLFLLFEHFLKLTHFFTHHKQFLAYLLSEDFKFFNMLAKNV